MLGQDASLIPSPFKKSRKCTPQERLSSTTMKISRAGHLVSLCACLLFRPSRYDPSTNQTLTPGPAPHFSGTPLLPGTSKCSGHTSTHGVWPTRQPSSCHTALARG
eukprot:jgi/Mesvir1/27992/Mv25892-RA.1